MGSAVVIDELKKLQGEFQRKSDYHTAAVINEAIDLLCARLQE